MLSRHVTPRHDDVATLQDALELGRREPHLSEAGVIILDENPLLLSAVNVDLGHIGEEQDLVAHVVRDLFELTIEEVVAHDGHDDAEDVSELIVHNGAARSVGQKSFGVFDLPPQVVPDGLDVKVLVENIYPDDGCPRRGFAFDVVEFGNLLNFFLKLVGHEELDALGAGAGKRGSDRGGADDKAGVFGAWELYIGHHARYHNYEQGYCRDAVFLNGGTRDVHYQSFFRSRTFTSSPSLRRLTPAVTTSSPSSSPSSTSSPSHF